jgi:hypothetical protein
MAMKSPELEQNLPLATRAERAMAAARAAIKRSQALRAKSRWIRDLAKARMAALFKSKKGQNALSLWFSLAYMVSSIASLHEELSCF